MAEDKTIQPVVAIDVSFSDDAAADTYAPTTAIKSSITPVGPLPRDKELAIAQDGGAAFIHAAINGGINGGREFNLRFFGADLTEGADKTLYGLLINAFKGSFAGTPFAAWVDANPLPGAGDLAINVTISPKTQGPSPTTYAETVACIVTDVVHEQEGMALAINATLQTLEEPTWA